MLHECFALADGLTGRAKRILKGTAAVFGGGGFAFARGNGGDMFLRAQCLDGHRSYRGNDCRLAEILPARNSGRGFVYS